MPSRKLRQANPPEPVPVDLTPPSDNHVDYSLIPETVGNASDALTNALQWIDEQNAYEEPLLLDDSAPEGLESKVDRLIEAVQVIGAQQQWVTDRVAELGPLFAQVDSIFAGAQSPVDLIKALMGFRGKVIQGDAAGQPGRN